MNKQQVGGYSNIVVGGLMGLGFIGLAFWLAGLVGGSVLCIFLLYEGWTLLNKFPEDTLSESVWRLSDRPMVPFVFGVTDGLWTYHVFLINPMINAKQALLWGAMQFLFGHFFFQAKKEEKKATAEEIARNIGKVSLAPERADGAVSVVEDHTGKVSVVQKAMGINKS